MPWKPTNKQEQRFELVRQMRGREITVTGLCGQFKISRQTAYKWRQRFRTGRLEGLKDRSRRPTKVPRQTDALWLRRLKHLRRRKPTWGARKLRHCLKRDFGRWGLPALATISRWLKRWGLARGKQRRRPGPIVLRPALQAARCCHDVWTVDFKGTYRTREGMRVEPLTVRDLYSRYGLGVALLRRRDVVTTRKQFARIFGNMGCPGAFGVTMEHLLAEAGRRV